VSESELSDASAPGTEKSKPVRNWRGYLNFAGATRRMRPVQCGERRLNALGRILDDAAHTGDLPPVKNLPC